MKVKKRRRIDEKPERMQTANEVYYNGLCCAKHVCTGNDGKVGNFSNGNAIGA